MFRLRLALRPLQTYGSIPFSYNQQLASAVGKKLTAHGIDSRFAVSNLDFEKFEINNGRLFPAGRATITISILTTRPFDEFHSVFYEREFAIGDNTSSVRYQCSSIEKESEPRIEESMSYFAMSPMVVRQKRDNRPDKYLLPGDRFFGEEFFDRAYYRWLDTFNERVNLESCQYRPQGKIKTKLISIVKNNFRLDVRGYVQHFNIIAPPQIHKSLLYGGAGDLNGSGFGCVALTRQ